MYGEDPRLSPDFARMTSEHDAERLASYIRPGNVVHGGRFDVKARYVEPTLLYPSTWDDLALQQEVFGPVLPVMTYPDLKEIVGVVKHKPKPLAAYIFSKVRRRSTMCWDRCRSAAAWLHADLRKPVSMFRSWHPSLHSALATRTRRPP